MKLTEITIIIASAAFAALAASCSRGSEKSIPEPESVDIARIDLAALRSDTAAFDSLRPASTEWLTIIGADTADVAAYFDRVAGKPYNDDVIAGWTDTDSLARALALIFNNVAKVDGLGPAPRVGAVISPYNQSVVTADSLLFIALNHYLGPEKEYYAYFPDYQRRAKSADRIGVDVATALVTARFPFEPSRDYPTALERMVREGAVVETVMKLTGRTEREVLGYTEEEYRWLRENEQQAWMALLSRGLLFSTDPAVAEGLVRPGAVTSVLHHESPGSAGRYIGHRIVRAYLRRHPSTPISSLLSPEFYGSETLLEEAQYDGK